MAKITEKRTSKLILDGTQPAKTLADLGRDVRVLGNHMKKLDRGSDEFKSAAKKMKQLRTELYETNNQMRAVNKSAKSFGTQFKSIVAGVVGGNILTSVVNKIADVIPRAINKNKELADSYADIQKTTNLTAEETIKLDALYRGFDTRTPRRELRELTVEAGRLGIRGVENLASFVKVMDEIKVALGDDLGGSAAENIRVIGKLTEQYKVAEKEQVEYQKALLKTGSAINELAASGSNQAEYQINFAKRVTGALTQANIAIQDAFGYAATLDEAGQNVEVSATTTSKAITQMYTNTAQYAEIAGVSLKEFEDLLTRDANEAFKMFLKGLNGNNEGLRKIALNLEDAELSGSRAVGVLATLASNLDKLEDKQQIANSALVEGTSLTEEFNKKNNNLAGTIDKIGKKLSAVWTSSWLKSAIGTAVIQAGELLGIHQKESETLEEMRVHMNTLINVAKGLNVEDQRRVDLIKELNLKYGDYLPQLIDEKAHIDELIVSQEKSNDLLKEKIELTARDEVFSEKQNELKRQEEGLIERQIQLERFRIKESKLNRKDRQLMAVLDTEDRKVAIKYLEDLIATSKRQVGQARQNLEELRNSLYGAKKTDFNAEVDQSGALGILDKINASEQSTENDELTVSSNKTKSFESVLKRFEAFKDKMIRTQRELSRESMSERSAELDKISEHYEEQKRTLKEFYDQKIITRQEYRTLIAELEAMEEEEARIKEAELFEKQIEKDQVEAEQLEKELQQKQEFAHELDLMKLSEQEREIQQVKDKYAELIKQAEQYGLETVDLTRLQEEEIFNIKEFYRQQDLEADTQYHEDLTEVYRNFYNGLLYFLGAFGEEESSFAEFQKGLAFFQIAIDQATAVSQALTNSQSPTPDNIATGGIAGLAKFAVISGAILKTIGAAKELIMPAPSSPGVKKLGTGGRLKGPKHTIGGMPVYSYGQKVMELEGDEVVLSGQTAANNVEVVDRLLESSTRGGGRSISQIPHFDYSAMTQAAQFSGYNSNKELQKTIKLLNETIIGLQTSIDAMPEEVQAYLIYEHMEDMVLENRRRNKKAKTVGKLAGLVEPRIGLAILNERLDNEI